MREVNKSLQFEVDDLKQKLKDAQGDIKVSNVIYIGSIIYDIFTNIKFCECFIFALVLISQVY